MHEERTSDPIELPSERLEFGKSLHENKLPSWVPEKPIKKAKKRGRGPAKVSDRRSGRRSR